MRNNEIEEYGFEVQQLLKNVLETIKFKTNNELKIIKYDEEDLYCIWYEARNY